MTRSSPDLDILRAAYEDLADAVDVSMPDERHGFSIVYVNPAFEELLGHPADEVVGTAADFWDLADGSAGKREDLVAALARGEAVRLRPQVRTADDELIRVDLSLSPITGSSGPMVVGISRRVDDIVHVPFRSGSLDLVEICSGCGRIRTPDGEFVAVEELLSEVLGSVIQRGLCQACYELADPTDL